MNIQTIVDKVNADDAGKWDIISPEANMKMVNKKLLVEGRPLGVSNWAMGQICSKHGIPKTFTDHLPAEVSDPLFNYFLSEASPDKKVLIRARGETVRGYLSDKYSKLDNSFFFGMLSQALNFEHTIKDFWMDDQGVWLKVIVDGLQKDDCKVLLIFGNSEVGSRSLSFGCGVFRKVCTNDLVLQTESSFDVRHIYLSQKVLQVKLAESVCKALEKGNDTLDTFLSSKSVAVSDPRETIKRLCEKNKMPLKTYDSVLSSYEKEPEPNKFGVANAFTRAAQAYEGDNRIDLEMFAGKYIMGREA